MRAAFFLLLFVNLAFLAWAEWIDAPQPVPVNAEYAKLPRLQLVDEGPHGRRPSSGAPAPRKTATEDAPPSAAPTLVVAVTAQCLSVGPFEDSAAATRGASVLQGKGLTPRQRSTEGQVSKGYWVFIGGLKSERDVQQVLRTLEQSHVDDAREMPDTGDLHQVSVGLFSDLDRADRRAQSVQKLGLQPEVAERKVPGTVFWMDVDVASGAAAPNPQDLASGGEAGAATAGPPIRVVPCPTSAPSTTPAAQPVPSAPQLSPTFRTKVATGTPKMP